MNSKKISTDAADLAGSLLIASPGMIDSQFQRSVVYVIAHSSAGAMGLVINHVVQSLPFGLLMQQLGVDTPLASTEQDAITVHRGGPVDGERGFVLHSNDYRQNSTLHMGTGISLTATLDILKDIAVGRGPRKKMLVLGYAGWDAGELEREMLSNSWVCMPAEPNLVFDIQDPWTHALAHSGVDAACFSSYYGHA